ncbi:MAG: response regulator transcription factor, partial [Rhodopirellula bahusiensis]
MNQTLQSAARIAIVDDHGIVRFGYSQLINQQPMMEVCGAATGEQDGFELIKTQQPDLAIIDLSLGHGDGLDLLRSLAEHAPKVKLLVISAHDERLFAHRVLAAGARGFINKQEAPDKLIVGIQAILQDGFFFSEDVTRAMLSDRMGSTQPASRQGIDSLTNRELQVFTQIGKGRNTREIADGLYLSVKTIERHKENIKRKLGLENATQLTCHATQWVLD